MPLNVPISVVSLSKVDKILGLGWLFTRPSKIKLNSFGTITSMNVSVEVEVEVLVEVLVLVEVVVDVDVLVVVEVDDFTLTKLKACSDVSMPSREPRSVNMRQATRSRASS